MGLAVRSGIRLEADTTRVISRLFIPGQELVGGSEARTSNTVERVLAISEADAEATLAELFERFEKRPENLADIFERHAERIIDFVKSPSALSAARRALLGAAFTHEYSLEGAAVCNPSFVAHFDQNNVPANGLRVILSYRSIGEGHHSSICFRTGMIDSRGELTLDEPKPFPHVATTTQGMLDREVFHAKLHDLGNDGATAASVLNHLGDRFTSVELDAAIAVLATQSDTRLNVLETAELLRSIAATFYVANFDTDTDISQRVLWPSTATEGQGVEDARFVRFEDAGAIRYMASYTAYDGHNVSQQMLETTDFLCFESTPLAGVGSRNKGLAFFPRLVGGRYVALSRHDRESNHVAFSSNCHRWDQVSTAQMPHQPWEILQLGNCGSPIELEEGWLVITHGVGPMRTYGIGALLLDLEDPTVVLAQLPRPLLLPDRAEQDGYVPNVVYSCGSIVHNGTLYLPYGIADHALSFVTVNVQQLIDGFEPISHTM